jgi:hypothetical protein
MIRGDLAEAAWGVTAAAPAAVMAERVAQQEAHLVSHRSWYPLDADPHARAAHHRAQTA